MATTLKPTEKPINRVTSNYTNLCSPESTELSDDLMDAMSKSVEQALLYKKARKRLAEAREIVRSIAEEGKQDREIMDIERDILKKDLAEKYLEIENISKEFDEMQKQRDIIREEKDILEITIATVRKEFYNLKSDFKSELSNAEKRRVDIALLQIELNKTKASLAESDLNLRHKTKENDLNIRAKMDQASKIIFLEERLGKIEKEHSDIVEKKDKEIRHLKHEFRDFYKIKTQKERLQVAWGFAKKRKLTWDQITKMDYSIDHPEIKFPGNRRH